MSVAQNSVFRMENLAVTRGDREILKEISWEVKKGQHWALIGGNGSGKTSLLRVLMGYFTPSQGEIIMEDRNAAVHHPEMEWDQWRRRIGFVSSSIAEMIEPIEPAIDVIMAGRHAMINYWQRVASVEKDDRLEARKILKKIQCLHLENQPWAFLSQGERQRLLIGRALMAPKLNLLILDEPCAGLDPVAREHFLRFLQELTADGSLQSLIMVTHHVEEIIPGITHALVLRHGKILSMGPKREALTTLSISRAFGGDLRLCCRNGRYRIDFSEEELDFGQLL